MRMPKWSRGVVLMVLGAGLGVSAGVARADDILSVLDRSHEQRLESFIPSDPDSADAAIVTATFRRLLARLDLDGQAELRVVRPGTVIAETLQGHVVVASEELARLEEGERLFILAHELGHVRLGHWAQMSTVYQKYVPGVVAQAQTDAVAGLLGREASAVAHRQEFEADAFGLKVVTDLGYAPQVVVGTFVRLGMRADTATHPSSRKRVAHLRQTTLEERGAAPDDAP